MERHPELSSKTQLQKVALILKFKLISSTNEAFLSAGDQYSPALLFDHFFNVFPNFSFFFFNVPRHFLISMTFLINFLKKYYKGLRIIWMTTKIKPTVHKSLCKNTLRTHYSHYHNSQSFIYRSFKLERDIVIIQIDLWRFLNFYQTKMMKGRGKEGGVNGGVRLLMVLTKWKHVFSSSNIGNIWKELKVFLSSICQVLASNINLAEVTRIFHTTVF